MSSPMAAQVFLGSLFLLLMSKFCTGNGDEHPNPYETCSIIGFPKVSNEKQIAELRNIPYLDFFVGPSLLIDTHVMACGEEKDKLKQLLASYKIKPVILVEDFSQMQRSRDHFGNLPLGQLDFNDYYGVETIYAWLDEVVKKYPNLISMQVIGTTYERRELRIYKIEKTGGSSYRKATYIECLLHPREWTISLVCPYVINQLTANATKYSYLLDEIRFYILPIANPDGFAYSNGTNHDLWRKNRRPIPGTENITCPIGTGPTRGLEPIGADLNRNWPFQWQRSPYVCAHEFPGEESATPGQPVIEAELVAITNFLLSHKDIDTFIDIHAYAQLVMFPWAYSSDRVPNYSYLLALAKAAAEAAESLEGIKYQPGSVRQIIGYPSAGSSVDWVYAVGKKTFPFALELRPDTKTANDVDKYIYPFRVYTNEILPVCIEGWRIVQVLASKKFLNLKSVIDSGAGLVPSLFFLAASFCSILLH